MTLPAMHERFIDLWGSMGMLWGINRSMARIHAYIMIASAPVGLDEIVKELAISKGNASMSLNELRNWGVIMRTHKAGDRRDFYGAEPDSWKMLFNIARERKKREFDPALNALRDLLAEGAVEREPRVAERLGELEKLLAIADRVAAKFLADEKHSRSVMNFLNLFLAQ
jgi:HTH-type transcriptional regulator, glycine betaine synthesis regulator